MKRYLISFADSRMKKALNRFRSQAEKMLFFDSIELFTEKDLDDSFLQENAHLLKPFIRGFGYWKWKPYIIYKTLQKMKDGEELYYIDAGCHLNANGRPRMFEYAERLKNNELGLAGFQLGKNCSEKMYTKMDLLIHMGVDANESILCSGQICTGHIFCIKSPRVVNFIEEWMKAWHNIHFIDDSPSDVPNFPDFVEHRHDQSVFSILCKLHGAERLPGNETWPAHNSRDWSTMQDYPIWDKRDLGWTSHIFSRIFRKIKKIVRLLLKRHALP